LDLQQPVVMEDEIDLREILLALWRGKWIILGLMIAAAAVAAIGGRILLTPSYEAVAALLIVPPTYQSAIEPEPLPLETYRALALTPSIASQVIERLQLTDEGNKPLGASDVLKAVQVDVSAGPDSSGGRAGMLNIKVSWSDPVIARDIANAWADVFMRDTAGIRKSESDEIARVILNQFVATEEALNEAEDQLLRFRIANSIPRASQQVELLSSHLGERHRYMLKLQADLEIKRNRLDTLSGQLSALEHEGQWLGLLTHDIDKLSDNGNAARKRIIDAVRQLVAAKKALRDFEDNAEIALLEQELASELEALSSYKKGLTVLAAQVPQLEARARALTVSLEKHDKTMFLSRSLTTDAMWTAISSGSEALEQLQDFRLVDEVPNPTYQELEKSLANTETELASLPEKIQGYEKLINASVQRIVDLNQTLRELYSQREALEEEVAVTADVYDSLKAQYLSLKKEWLELANEVSLLEAELKLASEQVRRNEEEFVNAEGSLLQLTLEEEQLTRNVASLKQTYKVLAEQAENARLAEMQATGDVRFVSPAVAPRTPSGPNHKLNIVIAALLGGMIGLGVVLVKNMLMEPAN